MAKRSSLTYPVCKLCGHEHEAGKDHIYAGVAKGLKVGAANTNVTWGHEDRSPSHFDPREALAALAEAQASLASRLTLLEAMVHGHMGALTPTLSDVTLHRKARNVTALTPAERQKRYRERAKA